MRAPRRCVHADSVVWRARAFPMRTAVLLRVAAAACSSTQASEAMAAAREQAVRTLPPEAVVPTSGRSILPALAVPQAGRSGEPHRRS
jgi:hypothetical protein